MMSAIKLLFEKTRLFRLTERRKHERRSLFTSLRFLEMNGKPSKGLHHAKSKNVSKSGMKITSMAPLERNSVALLDLDLSAIARQVREAELLLVSHRRILAEVKWRTLNLQTGLFESGLQFIDPARRREFETQIAQAKKLEQD